MTKESYEEGKKLIDEQYNKAKKQLAHQYAMSNNPYKEGDIISDHSCTIKIDKIGVDYTLFGSKLPSCLYVGTRLTQKGEPFKSGERTAIYQTNIVK